MYRLKSVLLVIFLFLNFLHINSLIGQDSTQTSGFFIGVGIGTNYYGPTLCGNISYINNHHLFTIKYSKSDELRMGVENNFDEPTLYMSEIGILYGRYHKEKSLILKISAGISYLNGINRGSNIQENEYENINISTIGIPFETGVIIEFTDYFGIELLFYGNFNNEKTYTGGMFRLTIGRF